MPWLWIRLLTVKTSPGNVDIRYKTMTANMQSQYKRFDIVLLAKVLFVIWNGPVPQHS